MADFPNATAEKAAYCSHWSQNAGSFASQGCYEWMAEHLDSIKPAKVLDIGCGTGEGLQALLARFNPQVIAIDENMPCLRDAEGRLRKAGVSAVVKERFTYAQQPNGRHTIQIDQRPIPVAGQVTLIQGDALLLAGDAALAQAIQNSAPFDAMTVWLIGTYKNRESCINLDSLRIKDPQEYRLHIQNRMFKLGSEVLRPGGALQIVDRGEALTSADAINDALDAYREQAELGDLQVQDLRQKPYAERASAKGVAMIASPGKSGRMVSTFTTVMTSVIATKPAR